MRLRRNLPVAVVCVLFAGSAWAGRVAPLLPKISPAPPTELRSKLQAAVARGIESHPNVVAPGEIRAKLTEVPDLADCTAGPCLERLASVLRADRLLVTEIDQVGKNYSLRLRVVGSDGQALGKPIEERCDICTVREVETTLQQAAAKLVPVIATAATTPSPEEPRTAPSARAVASPPRAAAPRAGTVAEDDTEHAPPPAAGREASPHTAAAPAGETSRLPLRALAIASFGLAGASLVGAIVFAYFASKEGQGSCDKPDPIRSCPQVYRGNIAPTVTFGVVTGLAAAAGAALWILDSRRNSRRPSVALLPSPDGVTAWTSLDF